MKTTKSFSLTLLLTATMLTGVEAFADDPQITVFKTPSCGCCSKWVSHLRDNGMEVETVDLTDLKMVKSMAGIRPEHASCHTAKVGDYVIEGHVPAEDIKRLLAERPDAKGLAVPGMPTGSPGMDMPNATHYQVMLLGKDGSAEVFAEH